MDTEIRNELRQLREVTEENNKILRTMRRGAWYGRILKIIYWVAILGFTAWTYHVIAPYLTEVKELYETTREAAVKAQNFLPGR